MHIRWQKPISTVNYVRYVNIQSKWQTLAYKPFCFFNLSILATFQILDDVSILIDSINIEHEVEASAIFIK